MLNKNLNKNNVNIDEIKHNYNLIVGAIIFICIGIFMILKSYCINKNPQENIWAFLLLNFGGLLIFVASYNLFNELLLKKNFVKQMRKSIDEKLERISLSETIQKFGLYSIQHTYSKEALIKRISSSNSVLMLAIRNAEFFRYYCPELRESIVKDDLHLTILMLNPSSEAIPLLVRKFRDTTEESLSNSLKEIINIFIKMEIYDKLPKNKKSNLKLRLFDQFPVYSAYVFDDEEIWFTPYYFRPYKRPSPVFILKGKDRIHQNEIYKDIRKIQTELTTTWNLAKTV